MNHKEIPSETTEFIAWNNKLMRIMPELLLAESRSDISNRTEMVLFDFIQYLIDLINARPEAVGHLDQKTLAELEFALDEVNRKSELEVDYRVPGSSEEITNPSLRELLSAITSLDQPQQLVERIREQIQK